MCDHCGCREHPPIMELTVDHERILALAAQLSDTTRHHHGRDSDVTIPLADLLDAHAAKEETGLYPLLITAMGEEPDAFEHLEEEHRAVLDAIGHGTFDHHALYALQRHIEEEEEVLFSSALFYFDGDTWDELAARSGPAAPAPRSA